MPWLFLAGAIVFEVVATAALKLSEGFTRLGPTRPTDRREHRDPTRSGRRRRTNCSLLAARHPDIQAELTRWADALDALVARVLADPVERAGIVAAVDGLFLRCLCSADSPDAGEVLEILNRLVRRG